MSRYTSKHTGSEIDAAIDRAKAGGIIDTLLARKAPAGYGLGTTAKLLTADDNLYNIRANGFYGWASSLPTNAPAMYMSMRVENDSYTGHVVQTLTGWNDSSNPQMRRIRTDPGWQQWEYINPPMKLGVEYRTTERHQGKPVYVKLVNFGPGANNTEKRVVHGASNAIVIDYGGYSKDDKGALSVPWMTHSTLSVSSTDIVMTANANYSGFSVYVWIKYYKTTD